MEQKKWIWLAPRTLPLWFLTMFLMWGATESSLLANESFLADGSINKVGLTTEWSSQAELGAGGQIVDWALDVDENISTTFFSIKASGFREVISQHSLNAFGEPLGLDGAVEYVEIKKEILEAKLKNDGVENPEIVTDQYTLPKSTIYLLTSGGLVTALDADTGNSNWTTEIGSPMLPNIGIGVSTKYVAAINGSRVYCLETSTGKILWSQSCKSGVSAAPAVSNDRIYVPLFDGRVEVFLISEKGYDSFVLVANGAATARPRLTDESVSWPTRSGHLNVASVVGPRQRSVSYRLKTDQPIESTPAFKDGILYTASLDGYVFALEEKGSLVWETSVGEGISHAPIALGDSLFLITIRNRLIRIDASSGNFVWAKPLQNIERYIGSSENRLYLKDQFGQLVVVNSQSGAILSRVDAGDIDQALPNQWTDRLYIASKNGLVQCLREATSSIPVFLGDEIADSKPTADSTPTDPGKTSEGQATPVKEDPFAGGGADPFATKGNSATEDPFATGAQDDDKKAGSVDDDPFK